MLGTCQLPQCWSLGRRMMLMSDKTVDPCESLYDAACGGWLANVSSLQNINLDLDNVSVMDHNKLNIDKKIRGEHLSFVLSDHRLFLLLSRSYFNAGRPTH